uniref:Uncharacterized protein n=1 Tax=Rhizophagus irregularis (strain DAOM 181602 / DAOM 197198 / MUCL 43194) TaxID=747089 RepID=U9SKU8_RHIID
MPKSQDLRGKKSAKVAKEPGPIAQNIKNKIKALAHRYPYVLAFEHLLLKTEELKTEELKTEELKTEEPKCQRAGT